MPAFSLDLGTALVMIVLASFTMAACLATVSAGQRQEGMGLWGAALLMQAFAYVLLALRGQVPDVVSIVLANGMLSGVYACVLAAIHRFQGRRLPWAGLVVPVVATLVLFSVFVGDYLARLVLAGILFPLQLLLGIWALYRPGHGPVGRGALLVAVGMGLQVVLLTARAVVAAVGAMPLDGLMRGGGLVQHLTFLGSFVTVQVSSLGFIFMAKDRADEANRQLAAVDPLTGVANRRSLISALDRDIARAVRTREPMSVMMVDIDHFKRVNDDLGHLAGDQVLCSVVEVLRARVRSQDLVGRYGGEEFMVVLPDTPLAGAQQLARQLCQAVGASRCRAEGTEIAVTVSIGVAGGRLEPGDSWDMLISAADRALYRAKENGRNRVEAADGLRRPGSQVGAESNPETRPESLY